MDDALYDVSSSSSESICTQQHSEACMCMCCSNTLSLHDEFSTCKRSSLGSVLGVCLVLSCMLHGLQGRGAAIYISCACVVCSDLEEGGTAAACCAVFFGCVNAAHSVATDRAAGTAPHTHNPNRVGRATAEREAGC